MNVIINTFLIGVLSLGGDFAAVRGQTADQIINRYFDAVGGRTRLESIQTLIVETISTRPGREGETHTTTYLKRPNLARIESSSSGRPAMRMTYDGKNAFFTPGVPVPPDSPVAARIRRNMNIYQNFGFLIGSQDGDFKAEYLGPGRVEGTSTERVKITYSDGFQRELDFEGSTGLLIRTQEKDEQGRIHSSIFSDFRSVEGIKFSFKQKNIGPLPDDPNGITLIETVSIKLNEPLEDDFFRLEKDTIKK